MCEFILINENKRFHFDTNPGIIQLSVEALRLTPQPNNSTLRETTKDFILRSTGVLEVQNQCTRNPSMQLMFMFVLDLSM